MTNNVYATQADELEADRRRAAGLCERCEMPECECDPTLWCSGCGATRKADCDCGPIAENE